MATRNENGNKLPKCALFFRLAQHECRTDDQHISCFSFIGAIKSDCMGPVRGKRSHHGYELVLHHESDDRYRVSIFDTMPIQPPMSWLYKITAEGEGRVAKRPQERPMGLFALRTSSYEAAIYFGGSKSYFCTGCGDCHDATGSGRFEVGPSFEDIANLPSTTALSLKAFLRSNHSNMPNFIISGADTDDVIEMLIRQIGLE